MQANPATVVKPPKPDHSPTMPFDHAQMDAIVAAADTFTQGKFSSGNRDRFAQ
jgi:hypothetical protein